MQGTTKKTKGKQKREMKKIENQKDLYISFTKRKDGLYKKSTELKALVDADVNLLIYSPSGNPYSYGDPSIESMTMTRSKRQQGDIYKQLVDEHKRIGFQQQNEKNDEFVDEANVLKERKKQLEKVIETKNNGTSGWWEGSNEELYDGNFGQSKEMEASLLDVEKTLKNKISLHDALDHQTNVGVGPYPIYASGGNLSRATSGFGNNALNLAASGAQFQGDGAFLYNASNENAGGSGSGAYYNASDENGAFPFPPFNGYGHGYY